MTGPSDRRGFLRGLATLPVAAPAIAVAHDPVLALVAREQEVWEWYNAGGSDEELDRRCDIHDTFERSVFATAPTTLAGLAAQIELYVRREGFHMWEPERYLHQIAEHARALGGAR